VRGENDLGLQITCASHGVVEVVDLEPHEDAVARGLRAGITEVGVIVLDVPRVQLEDQPIAGDEALVLASPVCARASEQPLIPRLAASTSWTASKGCGRMALI